MASSLRSILLVPPVFCCRQAEKSRRNSRRIFSRSFFCSLLSDCSICGLRLVFALCCAFFVSASKAVHCAIPPLERAKSSVTYSQCSSNSSICCWVSTTKPCIRKGVSSHGRSSSQTNWPSCNLRTDIRISTGALKP